MTLAIASAGGPGHRRGSSNEKYLPKQKGGCTKRGNNTISFGRYNKRERTKNTKLAQLQANGALACFTMNTKSSSPPYALQLVYIKEKRLRHSMLKHVRWFHIETRLEQLRWSNPLITITSSSSPSAALSRWVSDKGMYGVTPTGEVCGSATRRSRTVRVVQEIV